MQAIRKCAVAAAFNAILLAQSGGVNDGWAPVRFLVGTWEGDGNGQHQAVPTVQHCWAARLRVSQPSASAKPAAKLLRCHGGFEVTDVSSGGFRAA